MKKITDTQKYAILWLNHINDNSVDIAKKLKISEQQVIEIIQANASDKSSPSSQMKSLMITESMGQKHKVSVMTKAASEVADAAKQKNAIDNTTKNKTSFIYKPAGN